MKNKHNENLAGALTGELKDKLIIICHGLADTKDNPTFVTLAEELDEFAPVFRFDFSGNGESEGTFEEATYHKEVEDLEAVIDHFKEQGVKKFCLIGHSMGGGVVQVVAGKREEVATIISLAGVGRAEAFKDKFPQVIEALENDEPAYFFRSKKYPVSKKYVESTQTINIMSYAKTCRCPVLAVQGSNDLLIRKDHTQEWLDNLPHNNWKFEIIEGADHAFNRKVSEEAYEETMQKLLKILKEWLTKKF